MSSSLGSSQHCHDGSDEALCDGKQYTGCFLMTDLGLTITPCSQCFCTLSLAAVAAGGDDEAAAGQFKHVPAVFRSNGISWRSSNITGNICISDISDRLCDGVSDCLDNKDEHPRFCHRRGRKLHIGERRLHNNFNIKEEETITNGMLILIVASIVVLLLLLSTSFVFLFRSRLKRNLSDDFIHLEYKEDKEDDNIYVLPEREDTKEIMENYTIVQDLKNGFFSKVCLAKCRKSNTPVVMKFLQNQSKSVLQNEINILTILKNHKLTMQILGHNLTENLMILEYCQNGNMRDYIMKLGNSQGTLHKMDLVKSKFMLWSYQIASGMSFVTNLGIIHRNISLR